MVLPTGTYTVVGFAPGPLPSEIYVENQAGKPYKIPCPDMLKDVVIGTKLYHLGNISAEELRNTDRAELVAKFEAEIYGRFGAMGSPPLGITDVIPLEDVEEDELFNAIWNHIATMVDIDESDGSIGSPAQAVEIARRVAAAYAVMAFGPAMLFSV